MPKWTVIAAREYSAAVKTKTFLVTLFLMPLLMVGGSVVQVMTRDVVDTKTETLAIIDRTPGQIVGKAVLAAAERRNENDIFDKQTGRQIKPKFEVELIPPADIADKTAVDEQRFELSERIRNKTLLAFAEIGADIIKPDAAKFGRDMLTRFQGVNADSVNDPEKQSQIREQVEREGLFPDEYVIRYTTSRPTYFSFHNWFDAVARGEILKQRALKLGADEAIIGVLSSMPSRVERGLARRAADGSITYEDDKASQITGVLVPVVLVMLMFIVIMTGASPLTMNVVEEKQQRIAEVLLSSATPFDLMLGKLVGGVGTALTLAAIYLAGAFVLASQFDVLQYVRPDVIGFFLIFVAISTMMYGAMFVTAGSAVTNIKESQSLITPVILLIALPLFVLMPILQYPSGPIATFLSFFPLSAPLVTTIRLAVPPGIAMWEIVLSIVISLATTVALVWCASRIFRASLLMNSRPASMKEAALWIIKG